MIVGDGRPARRDDLLAAGDLLGDAGEFTVTLLAAPRLLQAPAEACFVAQRQAVQPGAQLGGGRS